jgi:hypothetical protein
MAFKICLKEMRGKLCRCMVKRILALRQSRTGIFGAKDAGGSGQGERDRTGDPKDSEEESPL